LDYLLPYYYLKNELKSRETRQLSDLLISAGCVLVFSLGLTKLLGLAELGVITSFPVDGFNITTRF